MKIYFASDFHLGVDANLSSRQRERQIIRWLDTIREDATELFLVGDLFDFWYEYRTVVPRGFTRLLGKLAELSDRGLPISIFTGNHDMWMFGYFEEEFDIPVFKAPVEREWNGKRFLIGHGDGLGPGDHGYKFIKKIFSNSVAQGLFGSLHPNWGIGIARFWSGKSRSVNSEPGRFLGPEQEWLIQYANSMLKTRNFDYFIFGHRHLPIDFTLNNDRSRYINLGEWLTFNSYAVFDGQDVQLRFFENPEGRIFPE